MEVMSTIGSSGQHIYKRQTIKMGVITNLLCPLCEMDDESIDHTFFAYTYSENLWASLLNWHEIRRVPMEWKQELAQATRYANGKSANDEVYTMMMAGCVYYLWQERKFRTFQGKKRSNEVLGRMIVQEIHGRGQGNSRFAGILRRMYCYPQFFFYPLIVFRESSN